MDKHLDNFINASSSTQKKRIGELLDEIKVSKEELPKIIKGIENFKQDAPVALPFMQSGSVVNFNSIDQGLSDVRRAVTNLFDLSNSVSLLLENSALLLESEVAALEDDLVAMEKAVDNYGFLVGGANAYNFSYIETFADDTGRDAFDICPDRASLSFGPAQKAKVNNKEGTLVLPASQTVSYDLKYSIVATNGQGRGSVNPDATTNSNNMTSLGVPIVATKKAWRTVIEAEAPVRSSLAQAQGYTGAQVVVDYTLSSAAPASEITVEPYADTPMELVQVTTFVSADAHDGEDLLHQKMLLDQPKTFHFPMRSVYKVRLVLNQPTYDRVSTATTAEDEYRVAWEALQNRLKQLKDKLSYNRAGDFNHLLFLVLVYFQQKNSKMFSNPKFMPAKYNGPAGIPALIEAIKRASRPGGSYRLGLGAGVRNGRQTSEAGFDLSQFVQRMFQKKDELYDVLASREVSLFQDSLKRKGIYDPKGVMSPLQMIYQNGWVYRYSLGLEKVAIGVGSSSFRGFHITKPFDAPGDIGEISIKTSQTNYRNPLLGKDNSVFTSVEYSVSNQSTPERESDWIPILPVGTTIIESERLYPDDTGRAALRFKADVGATVTVYRNNVTMPLPSSSIEYDSLGQTIVAVKIPATDYNPDDILTATYNPAVDATTVSFADQGFDLPPLTNANDSSGAGEGFAATSGNNEVALHFDPYVDQGKVAVDTYSLQSGMLSYQPIVVKLKGGEIATNLTNYGVGDQASLPSDGYYYIQSGRTLIFNRPITDPFRVYYQYLQNNVRVRTVLRCDSKNFVSPKVDTLQIKAKTRRPNRRGVL